MGRREGEGEVEMEARWRIQDFPEGMRQLLEERAPTYYLTNFPQKLHVNEEILAGGGRPWQPLRSATEAGSGLIARK